MSISGPDAARERLLIVISQIAALTCWFSASAVGASLAADLGSSGSGWLTSSVQVGFVVGAVASAGFGLADRLNPTRLYGVSALLAALFTVLIPLAATTVGTAAVLRFLTGVALAGVYPVGLKLMASWADPQNRARALGYLVGGLTIGSATPTLVRGVLTDLSWRPVLVVSAIVTAAGGLLALAAIRVGPAVGGPGAPLAPGYAVTMLRSRLPRLAVLGYLGHMWELYAWWAWLPTFLVASSIAHGREDVTTSYLVAFAAIGLAGFVGCVVGGRAADRWGRSRSATVALIISGSCCLISPLLFGRGWLVMVPFALVWGAAVIADSGVFSTALSEVADQRYVGTALTAQTASGFLLTIVTISMIEVVAGWVSWQYAFVLLAVGPAFGALAMSAFGRRSAPARP